MSELTAAILGTIAGLLAGFIFAALCAHKSIEDAWTTAHEEGFREGMEIERICQANLAKEHVLFAREAEDDEDDPPECRDVMKAGR